VPGRAGRRRGRPAREDLTARHEILYDPDCGFCRVCVAVVLKWDRARRLRPVALTSSEGKELLAGMPESERMASWHLISPSWWVFGADGATNTHHLDPEGAPNETRSAGAAFSPLFRLLPGGAAFARLTDRFPAAAERGYRWVADRRSTFGQAIPGAVREWADRVISESAGRSR
jgi:predicted DCC family thiol-disulfide oxidoreductase YuxK